MAPFKISTTTTSITLGWFAPGDDGGCAISGYAVFMDDGAGGSIINEVNAVNDPAIRSIPTLRSATITVFPALTSGNTFRFIVTAFNLEGSTNSLITSILYAGVPSTPASAPTNVVSLTDQN